MEVFIIIFGAIITYVILYFVIKAAVRNGIIESRQQGSVGENSINDNQLPQKTCPQCNKSQDFDYPKCPYCNHVH